MSQTASPNTTAPQPPINIVNSITLIGTFLLAVIGVPWYGWANGGYTAFEWSMFGFFMIATGLGITAGYHRLWSHKAYDAHPIVQWVLAFFGAVATQNSILIWSSDHRIHHKHTDDSGKDPYAATRGFWYSHIGWILREHHQPDMKNVDDLRANPIVMWQHRNYLFLTLFGNFGLCIGLGVAYALYTGNGRFWGVFMLACILRFVLNHHFTFFINSACHFFGTQPYANKDSSRDNGLLALVTYGEGYHNFHHTFQADYRNGIRWWQFDPTKWLIWSLRTVGLTSNLKRISPNQIIKQKHSHFASRLQARMHERLDQLRDTELAARAHACYNNFVHALHEWCEERQRYLRFRQSGNRNEQQRNDFEKRLAELKKRFEESRQALLSVFHETQSLPLPA